MEYDEVGSIYIRMVEMAMDLGRFDPSSPGGVLESEENRKSAYSQIKSKVTHMRTTGKYSLHGDQMPNDTFKYFTLNDEDKEVHHIATFKRSRTLNGQKFDHVTQTQVVRYSKSDLPKGYSGSIMDEHSNRMNLPLVSSDTQQTEGHEMWRRYVKDRISSHKNIYYVDSKNITKSNPENVDGHLDSYFVGDESGKSKHMIISGSHINTFGKDK